MPSSAPEPLFLQSKHEVSGRWAIVDEVEGSVWLYWLPIGAGRLEKDCWLIDTVARDVQRRFDHYRPQGIPPPAASGVVALGGV